MQIEHVNIDKQSEKEKRRKRRNQIDRRRRKLTAKQRRDWVGIQQPDNYIVQELQVAESIAICELCGKVGGTIYTVCSTCTGETH